jgi:hypothetical protein
MVIVRRRDANWSRGAIIGLRRSRRGGEGRAGSRRDACNASERSFR